MDLDERVADWGMSATDVLAGVGGVRTLQGAWLASRDVSVLSLEVSPSASSVTLRTLSTPEGELCAAADLRIETTLTVSTDDEAFQAEVSATIILDPGLPVSPPNRLAAVGATVLEPASIEPFPAWNGGYARVHTLRSSGPEVLPGAGEVALGALFDSSQPQVVDVALFRGEDVFGYWSNDPDTEIPPPLPPDPVLYTPPPLLADSCASAADFESFGRVEYTSFESEAAARQGSAGTWARCTDYAPSEHVALQIHEDGSWNHLVLEGDKLVERHGFGHEGYLWLSDAQGRKNQQFGLFQANMYPFGRLGGFDSGTTASDQALVFGSQEPTWPAAVYLPTNVPVRDGASAASIYSPGERAGAAACSTGERDIPATVDESEVFLTGAFALCSGALGEGVTALRFEGKEVELFAEDGTLIVRTGYRVAYESKPGMRLNLAYPNRTWQVVVSRQPLKLWIAETWTILEGPSGAVFSALP